MEEKAIRSFAGELGSGLEAGHSGVARGRAGAGVGARHARTWEGLCDRGGAGAIAWGCKYRDGSTHVGRTVCFTHPEQKRPIRVADKCGFKAVQQTTYKGSQRFF